MGFLLFLQGLLQSETIQDGTNQVGFFGKCLLHASFSGVELEAIMNKMSRAATSLQTCARTEVISCLSHFVIQFLQNWFQY